MKALLFKLLLFACFALCFVVYSRAQDKKTHDVSLKIKAGNSIATKGFFADEPAQNISHSGFINLEASTNLFEKDNKSLFLGLEVQALNFYPSNTYKHNLAAASLLVGKTRRFDIANACYLKQTNGWLVSTLLNVSVPGSNVRLYSGDPIKNLNLGVFSNVQVLFADKKWKRIGVDYGLGLDFVFRGIQLYKDRSFPAYLTQNPFIQYGLNLNVIYSF